MVHHLFDLPGALWQLAKRCHGLPAADDIVASVQTSRCCGTLVYKKDNLILRSTCAAVKLTADPERKRGEEEEKKSVSRATLNNTQRHKKETKEKQQHQ